MASVQVGLSWIPPAKFMASCTNIGVCYEKYEKCCWSPEYNIFGRIKINRVQGRMGGNRPQIEQRLVLYIFIDL